MRLWQFNRPISKVSLVVYRGSMAMKACPSCSVISETEKGFCPDCGTSYDRSSATAAANPATAKTKGSPVQVLAVAGLAAYVLHWFSLPLFNDYWGWGETFKYLLGFEALSALGDGFARALPLLFGALSGYILLAIVILGSKKSS